jgi:hypothetical protein
LGGQGVERVCYFFLLGFGQNLFVFVGELAKPFACFVLGTKGLRGVRDSAAVKGVLSDRMSGTKSAADAETKCSKNKISPLVACGAHEYT